MCSIRLATSGFNAPRFSRNVARWVCVFLDAFVTVKSPIILKPLGTAMRRRSWLKPFGWGRFGKYSYAELFEFMTGLPVTIRLLDPPLHEFLPKTDEEVEEVAKAMKVSPEKLRARTADLHEFTPMLGFRGVRLEIRYPEIAEMQARAIFEGSVEAGRKTGQPGSWSRSSSAAPSSTW